MTRTHLTRRSPMDAGRPAITEEALRESPSRPPLADPSSPATPMAHIIGLLTFAASIAWIAAPLL